MLLVSVPNPCHEDWNKMTPNEKGAFCKLCSKTVVDFTGMSDDEVKNYFLQHIEQRTCGHFRNDQLTDAEIPLILKQAIPLWKKFVAIVFILFGGLLTSCKDKTERPSLLPGPAKLLQTTSGVTLTEITETKVPDQIEIVCTVTNGFAAPVVIMQNPICLDPGAPPEIAKIDTILKKVDSIKNIIPINKDCDPEKKDTTIYYEP